MTARGWFIGYALILGWMVLPFLPVMACAAIASLNDCVVHEGNATSCVVMGLELGEALYFLGMMGWFGLFTLPSGALAAIVFTVGGLFAPRSR